MPFSPLHAFLAIFAKIANFATIAIFAKIASLQGSGTFIATISSPLAIFAKIANSPKSPFSPKSPASKGPLLASKSNRQRLVIFRQFRHYMHGNFCQNRHFCQNRQPSRGHFWHPIQIASGCRFFDSFGIFAIACISGHKWLVEDSLFSPIILDNKLVIKKLPFLFHYFCYREVLSFPPEKNGVISGYEFEFISRLANR